MRLDRIGWILVSVCVGFALGLFVYTQYGSAQGRMRPDLSLVSIPAQTVSNDQMLTVASQAREMYVLPLEEVMVEHITTPERVHALYMSSWVAGTAGARERLVKFAESTDINALVIDIKDATGKVAFMGNDPMIADYQSYSNRVRNIREIIDDLHARGFYLIGRIAVFQDPVAAAYDLGSAVQNTEGDLWRDRNQLSWVDPSSEKHWDYITALARESYTLGFDEINLDYVRFPTDGNMNAIHFPLSGEKPEKSAVIIKFFQHIDAKLRQTSGIPVSADVFGLATTVSDTNDVGIGQNWIALLPYVDALCPMIYPSHYAAGSFGYQNPAKYPYEIITKAIKGAIVKTETAGHPIAKIRPWIQDFDMGAKYDAAKVQAQIRAAHDLGIYSYLSWDPANTYTVGGYTEILEKKEQTVTREE